MSAQGGYSQSPSESSPTNRLRLPELDPRHSVLHEAVKTGFQCMVEFLLKNAQWTEEELTAALLRSLSDRRQDLAELLLTAKASITELDFGDVCRTMDGQLVERFLKAGGDPTKENAFAGVLDDIRAKPLVGLYRRFSSAFPALNAQAALALSLAIRSKDGCSIGSQRISGGCHLNRPIRTMIESAGSRFDRLETAYYARSKSPCPSYTREAPDQADRSVTCLARATASPLTVQLSTFSAVSSAFYFIY